MVGGTVGAHWVSGVMGEGCVGDDGCECIDGVLGV